MIRYILYVKPNGYWLEVARFDARDNVDAFRQAAGLLPLEHLGLPVAFKPAEYQADNILPPFDPIP